MKFVKLLIACLLGLIVAMASNAQSTDVNPMCDDANVLTNVFDQVCWDCFLDGISLMGASTESAPDGAASMGPICSCADAFGVPEFGYPLGFWSPSKLNEVVTTPWCSPSLGGIKLQDTLTGLGINDMEVDEDKSNNSFYQYHYFSYPLMTMLGMLIMPNCTDGYMDFDLMYMSEIDPLWNDDMLSLLLNPEAIIFANPIAALWCSTDCVTTTANEQKEEFYGCAGCDGMLYPLTGNVNYQNDPVASSSLITQRVLASLHRKGLAQKTIGNDAMCSPDYYPTIPRSQYKFSLIYPVPEAGSPELKTSIPTLNEGTDPADLQSDLGGAVGDGTGAFKDCCHPMGMSTARWCTPYGGRTRPGKDNAYIYMIWNWRDCCVRTGRGNSD